VARAAKKPKGRKDHAFVIPGPEECGAAVSVLLTVVLASGVTALLASSCPSRLWPPGYSRGSHATRGGGSDPRLRCARSTAPASAPARLELGTHDGEVVAPRGSRTLRWRRGRPRIPPVGWPIRLSLLDRTSNPSLSCFDRRPAPSDPSASSPPWPFLFCTRAGATARHRIPVVGTAAPCRWPS
jgi:hypothetical protein